MAPRFIAFLLLLSLGGCTPVTSLSGRDGGDPGLTDAERAIVREQVEKAREDERWSAAWNQEVEAGADRGRLEAIALDALDDDSTSEAQLMFVELIEKWGHLTPAGRERASTMADAAVADRNWNRAVDVEIATAEDVPAYTRAFEVYRNAPPHKAPGLLQRIQDARKEATK